MTAIAGSRAAATILSLSVLVLPAAAIAQLSDVPRPLVSTSGGLQSATQIGRRVFIGGRFFSVGQSTRRVMLIDGAGAQPSALPDVNGSNTRAVSDGVGGVIVFGDFTRVGTAPQDRLAHFRADGTLDAALRVTADGEISDVAVAHGRIYLAGGFTTINGAARAGFAALDARTGQVLPWGTAVRMPTPTSATLAVSSTAVYVRSSDGHVWGVDAGSGAVRFRRTIYSWALAATSQHVFIGTSSPQGAALRALDPQTGADDPSWTAPFGFRYVRGPYGTDGTYFSLTVDGGRLLLAGHFDPDDNTFDNFAAIDIASGTRLPWPGVNGRIVSGLALVGDVVVLSLQYDPPELRSRTTGAPVSIAVPVQGSITSAVGTARGVVVTGALTLGGGTTPGAVASIDLDTGALVGSATRDIPRFSDVRSLATDGTWLFANVEINGVSQFHKIDPGTGASVATLPAPAGTSSWLLHVAGNRVFVEANSATDSTIWAIDPVSWTMTPVGLTLDGSVTAIASAADRVFIAGGFRSVNGTPRRGLASFHRVTGALLPWDAQSDGVAASVVTDGTWVWVSGEFLHIGGQSRRGLAQLDAATGLATAWNPDAPSGFRATGFSQTTGQLVRAADGTLLANVSGSRATVSGQLVDGFVAFAPGGRRLPWALETGGLFDRLAATPDCVLVLSPEVGCLVTITPPASLTVTQTSGVTTLAWSASAGQLVTGWRLEVGTTEGRSDVVVLDLPASQTAISAPLPPGGWVARVRAMTAAGISIATHDVSFAVGRHAAPLDLTARVRQRTASLAWAPPSSGAPAAYYLDLGRAPGVGGTGQFVAGTATGLTLDLEPGEYWGRLYALSTPTDTVGSRPSADVRIDVEVTQSGCAASPPPPVNLRAITSAGRVQLLWGLAAGEQLPGTWSIKAGSAPGAVDLGVFSVVGTELGIGAAVPRGTYFVRVSALNWCGEGPATAELRVDVP